MAFELRPSVLDDFGLVSALRLYVDRFKARTNIDVQLDLSEPLKRSDPHVEATLYRIIQEALTNVARHSHATVAQIDLHPLPTGISLDIADNGCGFAPEGAGQTRKVLQGLGVINMKERIGGLNGKFELQSAEGRGTRIHIEIPRQ
jgi:signal transduction histidine kinase